MAALGGADARSEGRARSLERLDGQHGDEEALGYVAFGVAGFGGHAGAPASDEAFEVLEVRGLRLVGAQGGDLAVEGRR